jgi:hypothetical protein
MNIAEQLSAIALLVDFLFGVATGVFGSAIFGSVRENRRMSLLQEAPDPVSAGARVIFGVFTRDDDGYLRSLRPGGGKAARDPRRTDSYRSHGKGTDR